MHFADRSKLIVFGNWFSNLLRITSSIYESRFFFLLSRVGVTPFTSKQSVSGAFKVEHYEVTITHMLVCGL